MSKHAGRPIEFIRLARTLRFSESIGLLYESHDTTNPLAFVSRRAGDKPLMTLIAARQPQY